MPLAAHAQNDQGRVVGSVRDPRNAVVAGANIIVKNERTGETRSSTSTDKGQYLVTALKPSFYTVSVAAPGFAKAEFTKVQISVGQELTLDVELKPQSLNEVVTVVGTQEPITDASSARIGANVNEREVSGLPINGRQLSQLYLQAPGSLNSGSGTFGDIRFSGRALQQNAIRFDGIEGTAIIDAAPGNLNGEIPSPFRLQSSLENVQEFRVDSNNYPAEFGTGTGGQISVVTKSGGNQLHGSLFEYLRNEALDARNFFDLTGKSKLRLNQFGGSVGGPIFKNKFFFFFNYEGYRLRSGINFVEAVPSTNVFARAVPAIRPLLDGFRGPGTVILAGASTNPDFDIAQLNASNNVNENSVGLRFDYRFNEKHSVYARFFRDQGDNNQPEGVTGRRAVVRAIPQNGVVALQSALGATLINEFKLGYNGALTRVNGVAPVINGIDFSNLTVNLSGSVANTGIAGQGSTSGIAVPGGLLRQNSATNGRGAPYTPYSISFIDNLNWVKGSHNVKFGVETRLLRLYTDRLGGITYTFSNLNDFLANRAQSIQLLGDVSAPSVFNNGAVGTRKAEQEYYIGYAQDEWKLRPNLTLSYGLRYEYYTPLREARGLNVQFDITKGILLPPNRDAYHSKTNNFGPRLALTWSPSPGASGFFGGGRTVLRGGFGIYNGPGQTEDLIQPIESDRISTTLSGGAFPADVNTLIANFVNNPNNRQYQPRAYAPDYQVPERVYQYSFSLQQELFYKMVLTTAYVGSQGRNLFLRSVANQIVAVRTNPNSAGNAIVIREFDIVQGNTILRPFAEIDYKTSGGHDSYNALQVSLARRFNSGLTLNSQYTLSKSYGNTAGANEALTSGNLARFAKEAPVGGRVADFDYDNGYNNFDVRHTFNLSAIYALPIGKGRALLSNLKGVGQALLGGWELGAILNARAGLPLEIRVVRPDVVYVDATGKVFSSPAAGRTAILNTPGGGASRNVRRPDLIPGVNPYLDKDRAFLNPAAFAIPQPGTYGNLTRNALRGPGFTQFDMIFNKKFALTESSHLEFRAEVFNLFNKTNFSNPPTTLPNALGTGTNQLQPGQAFSAAAAGNFGVLNRTVERTVGLGTNRQIQFALRYTF
ncbi:MAG: TonB-dependent receptor [Acidobacteria bacterium]|nr:TonB-dependent receptor [Acidobacteriota bacterium]